MGRVISFNVEITKNGDSEGERAQWRRKSPVLKSSRNGGSGQKDNKVTLTRSGGYVDMYSKGDGFLKEE